MLDEFACSGEHYAWLVNKLAEAKQPPVFNISVKLFNDDAVFNSMTPEEIDQELRDAGHDPDAIGTRVARVARCALAIEAIKQARSRAECCTKEHLRVEIIEWLDAAVAVLEPSEGSG